MLPVRSGRVTLDTKLVITAQPPATVTPGSSVWPHREGRVQRYERRR